VSAGGNLDGTGMDVNLIPVQVALHKANLRSVRGRLKDAFDIGTAEGDLREPGRYAVAGAVGEILGFQDGAVKTFHLNLQAPAGASGNWKRSVPSIEKRNPH
jgi:hypothetical protein